MAAGQWIRHDTRCYFNVRSTFKTYHCSLHLWLVSAYSARNWREGQHGRIGATLYVTMVTVTITFKWNLQFFKQNDATRSVLWPKICRKCDSGRGSVPDPAGGSHNAPPDLLVGWGADTPLHTPPHSAPRCSRLRRLDRRAPLTPNPGDATCHYQFLR